MNRENRRSSKVSDYILNGITYLSSMISILILISIFVFVFSKGSSLINLDLLKNDYWSNNYLVEIKSEENHKRSFVRPAELSEEASFSEKWGIAFVDAVTNDKQQLVLVEYIDPQSPFAHTIDKSAGANKGMDLKLEIGVQVEKIDFMHADGSKDFAGNLASQNASQIITALDEDAVSITSIYVKTAGGGIRGSLITTAILILVSLLIALPIGIAAAIYLNEYAAKSKMNHMIRSSIETLTGVPSIVYGLMGVTVLFPITKAFGASTTNILLGSLTMAIILLPTIIRSSEEALLVVPNSLRDASLSLGANQSQTIFKVVLPCAVPGILTGVLLSIGRVIGESAALIYTMGTFINDSPTLMTQGTSLAVHIWSVMSGEQPNFELASAISIIILIFVLCLNIVVKLLGKRLNKAWY